MARECHVGRPRNLYGAADRIVREKMPERSRGGRRATGMEMRGDTSTDNVSFDDEHMDIDAQFEELKKPVYKGKRLDDPIPTAMVCLSLALLIEG